MSHKKFEPDRFSRFDVYWIQTDRQAKFIYRLEPFTTRNYEYWNHFNERNYEYWTPAFWCKERILRNPIVFGYRKVKTRQYKKFKKDYNY